MATIYIVLGTTGEWADRERWDVCFRATKEAAEEVRIRCQKEADEYYKWRHQKRPQRSFLRRYSHLKDEEYRAADQTLRASMFDKFFSCDYTGTKYHVESLSEDPDVDPKWIAQQAWWAQWQAEQVAEQMRHCTLDDRSPFAKLGDLIKSKLTMR